MCYFALYTVVLKFLIIERDEMSVFDTRKGGDSEGGRERKGGQW